MLLWGVVRGVAAGKLTKQSGISNYASPAFKRNELGSIVVYLWLAAAKLQLGVNLEISTLFPK